MTYDVPVKCGGVLVTTGELVFADFDLMVVVPAKIEAEALRRAAKKVIAENATRRELRRGRTLRDVFKEYHTL